MEERLGALDVIGDVLTEAKDNLRRLLSLLFGVDVSSEDGYRKSYTAQKNKAQKKFTRRRTQAHDGLSCVRIHGLSQTSLLVFSMMMKTCRLRLNTKLL